MKLAISLLPLERTGAREADGEGEPRQKGFVWPQRGFVCLPLFALPWHAHKQQHLYVYCFRLPVKSCAKDRAALISWQEATWILAL